jgi:hypothetical protein
MPRHASSRLPLFGLVVVLAASIHGVSAQQPRDTAAPAPPRAVPAPVRDGATAAVPGGTGMIAGRVVHRDDPSRPVRRVMVALASANVTRRMAVSDDQGHFAFDGLPAGRYTLRLSKASYSATMYGANSVRAQGLTIALADGQHVTDLVATIMRGTVVTGRGVDERNVPIQGASVTTFERVLLNGRPTLRPSLAGGTSTDDRGVYRFYGFGMGDWVVAVRMPPLSVAIATPDERHWAAERAGGSTRPNTRVAPPRRRVRYPSVFYPGVTDPAAATVLTFSMSEEKSGIDIVVPIVPTATVTGRLLRSDGTPSALAQIAIVPAVPDNPIAPRRIAAVSMNGEFSIDGVEPGRYAIAARGSTVAPRAAGGPPPPADLWAAAEITVSGEDISGLDLALQPAMTAAGRVIFEGFTDTPIDPSRVTVRAVSETVALGASVGRVSPDGTFEISGLVPGAYRVVPTLAGMPAANAAWVVKSATAGTLNVIDEPFEIQAGARLPDIEIRFTERKTELTGTLLDQRGQPAPEFSVIVFGTNPAFWRQGSRWIAAPTRPASDGRFTITGLPPGEYFLAALTRFDPQEWYTQAFLEEVVPGALRVALTEGETTVQDIRLR